MSSNVNGLNPQSYLGVNASTPPNLTIQETNPNPTLWKNFNIGDLWINKVNRNVYILTSVANSTANWALITGGNGDIVSLTADDGNTALPNFAGTINLQGGTNINTTVTVPNSNNFQVNLDNAINLPGDITITAGNLNLPATNVGGTQGIINFNNEPYFNTKGTSNIFVGRFAGNSLIGLTGTANSGFGRLAISNLTTGNNNTAIGTSALLNLTSGSNNTGLGSFGGSIYNIESNNIAIGNSGIAGDNGVIRIGTNATHTSCYITGIDGVNVGSVARVVTENNNQLGTATITAGTNITVTPAANTITISGAASGVNWQLSGPGPITMTAGVGYIVDQATLVTFNLTGGVAGNTYRITLNNAAGSWTIVLGGGATMQVGAAALAVASVSSSLKGDSIEFICVSANVFQAVSFIGNLTVL